MTIEDYGYDGGGGGMDAPDLDRGGGSFANFKAAMGRKVGPFSIGAWILVVGGGLMLAWSIRNLGAKRTDAGEERPATSDLYDSDVTDVGGASGPGGAPYEPWTYYGSGVGGSEDDPLHVIVEIPTPVVPPPTQPAIKPCMYVPSNPGLPPWRKQTTPGRYYAAKAHKIMVVKANGKAHCQK